MQQNSEGEFIARNMEETPLAQFQPNYGSLAQKSIMNDPKGKSTMFKNENKPERKKSEKANEEEVKQVDENDVKKELEDLGLLEDWMLDDSDKGKDKKKKKGPKKSKSNNKNNNTPTSSL